VTVQTLTAGPISLRTNLPELEALFTRAPRVATYWIRDMIGRWFGSHYRSWRRGLNAWQRRMADRGAYQYSVSPAPGARSQAELRAEIARRHNLSLDGVVGRGVIRSDVVLAHELGLTILPRGGKSMAVPVGKFARLTAAQRRAQGLSSPDQHNQRFPGNQLFVLARRRRGARVAALVRKTGAKTSTGKDRLETVFVLARRVRIPATLGVVRTWDAGATARAQRQQQAADSIVRELAGELRGIEVTRGLRSREGLR
jgi:hypothetical protein